MTRFGLFASFVALLACEPPPRAPTGESVLNRLRATVVCGGTLATTAIIEGDQWSTPAHVQVFVTPPTDARFVVLRSADNPGSTMTITATRLTPGDRALTSWQSESIIGLLLGRPVIVPHTSDNVTLTSDREGHATIVVKGETMRQELEVVSFEDGLMTKSVRAWEGDELLYEAHFADPQAPIGCNDWVPRSIDVVIPKEVVLHMKYVDARWME